MNELQFSYDFAPTRVEHKRSTFDLSHGLKTTLTEGDLVPLDCVEVLPGDTFKCDTAMLSRMATPIYPVMDDSVQDIFYFYCPSRILWDHFKEFFGENTTGPWAQTTTYTIPQLRFDTDTTSDFGYGSGHDTIMSYFGVPSCLSGPYCEVSDLPNRAYRFIWNEFFRDENLQSPVPVYTDDTSRSFSRNGYGGKLLKVCKTKDYFTTCLPSPQKGNPIAVNLTGGAPIKAYTVSESSKWLPTASTHPVYWDMQNLPTSPYTSLSVDNSNGKVTGDTLGGGNFADIKGPRNLYADLNASQVFTINNLRLAFSLQQLLERDTMGTRFRETLLNHFGVVSPDATFQIPEYLGGCRTSINIDQVLQTSSTDSVSPQGNTSAYSLTTLYEQGFTKSFTEPGYLICLACIRIKSHTYCQGIARWLTRKERFSFYYPAMSNIGAQPVYKSEIFYDGTNAVNQQAFGYQEAWTDYRRLPNRLSGEFLPKFNGAVQQISSLASAWTYADFYTTEPSLGSQWIEENSSNIGNTLAVTNAPQFICDFKFDMQVTRAMPMFSIPGLIDHM